MVTCLAGSSAPSFGCVFSAHSVWGTSSLHTSSLGLYRAGAVLPCFHRVSRTINQDCLSWDFLHAWAQMKMILKADLILGSEASRQCCRISFSLLNADEHRINILYYVHVSLVAKIKYAQTWEMAWQQNLTAWEELKAWVVEMTSGLESSYKPSANNCQKQRFAFCLLAILNSRKIQIGTFHCTAGH